MLHVQNHADEFFRGRITLISLPSHADRHCNQTEWYTVLSLSQAPATPFIIRRANGAAVTPTGILSWTAGPQRHRLIWIPAAVLRENNPVTHASATTWEVVGHGSRAAVLPPRVVCNPASSTLTANRREMLAAAPPPPAAAAGWLEDLCSARAGDDIDIIVVVDPSIWWAITELHLYS